MTVTGLHPANRDDDVAEVPEETRVPAWVWCGAAALSLFAAAFVMSVVVHWLVHA